MLVADHERILELWQSEVTTGQMAEALGTTPHGIARIKADLELPKRSPHKSWHKPYLGRGRYDNEPEVDEEEMRHRMAKVQATWTDEMFVLRSKGRARPEPWEFPTISLSDIARPY